MAFTQNSLATRVKQPRAASVQIANADASAQKTVDTAGVNGSKYTALIATSTDTAAHDVTISRSNSGVYYPLGTVSVPAGAGMSSLAPSVNLLGGIVGLPIDSDGNPYLQLITGDILTVNSTNTVTAAKLISVTAPAIGDF
jgi:hypothetical protein